MDIAAKSDHIGEPQRVEKVEQLGVAEASIGLDSGWLGLLGSLKPERRL
jgi:hypothetical protein